MAKVRYILCCLTSYGKGRFIMFMFIKSYNYYRGAAVVFWFAILFSSYVIHNFFTYRIWIYIKERKRKEYKMITNVFLPLVLFWSWFVCWFSQETKIFEGILKYSLYLSILLTSTFMKFQLWTVCCQNTKVWWLAFQGCYWM